MARRPASAQRALIGQSTEPGKKWQDHASVIADDVANAQLTPRGDFTLFKAHGCAARYREVASADETRAADSIVIRTDQLAHWRNDWWMRDELSSRARHRVLLLVGFSGQDPVIRGEMASVLGEVFESVEPDGQPRVVVVDFKPNTADLKALIKIGLGEQPAAPETVSQVSTDGATTTGALLVLLAESIAHRLEEDGLTVAAEIDPRLASLVISAPIMLRWSYFLRAGFHMELMQRSNLQQFGDSAYVPLTAFPTMTGKVLSSREALRTRLGRTGPESIEEALENSGFIASGGAAYLPVGLGMDQLKEACASGEVLEEVQLKLSHPDLECFLVPTDAADTGVSLGTGREVPIA